MISQTERKSGTVFQFCFPVSSNLGIRARIEAISVVIIFRSGMGSTPRHTLIVLLESFLLNAISYIFPKKFNSLPFTLSATSLRTFRLEAEYVSMDNTRHFIITTFRTGLRKSRLAGNFFNFYVEAGGYGFVVGAEVIIPFLSV